MTSADANLAEALDVLRAEVLELAAVDPARALAYAEGAALNLRGYRDSVRRFEARCLARKEGERT